jgi:tRNA-dihydrouridine synthase 3
MALSQQLLSGQNDEWALVRRHESEKNFGVQVAGGYPNIMVPTAEMIGRELKGGVDFVDVNIGCPIDLVFNQGAGSACKFFLWDKGKWLILSVMDSQGRLGKILVGMNRALGESESSLMFVFV